MGTDPQLISLGPDIWIAEGSIIKMFGVIPFPTRMTVIRLRNGELILHSPIAYNDDLAQELAALGTVRHLVSPNWIHYAYIPEWAAALPDTVAWASPGVKARAKSQKFDISFDRDLGDTAPADWAADLDQIIVWGSKLHHEVVFFHKASSTLILTDLIENMHAETLPLWLRPFAWIAGILAPNGKVPLDMWMSFAGNKNKLRAALAQMLDWQPKLVVLAHGDLLRDNVPQRLREGFRNLEPLAKVASTEN